MVNTAVAKDKTKHMYRVNKYSTRMGSQTVQVRCLTLRRRVVICYTSVRGVNNQDAQPKIK